MSVSLPFDDGDGLSHDEIRDMELHYSERVLRFLEDREVVTTMQFVHGVGHRFSTGIDDLRKQGYQIESKRDPEQKNMWIYRLLGKPVKMFKVKKAHQIAYYSSGHWATVRKGRLVFDGWKCAWCHSKRQLHVHHWYYRLFDERIDELMTLCDVCHEDIHSHRKIKLSFPKTVNERVFQKLEDLVSGRGA